MEIFLSGGDLRTIGKSNSMIARIHDQEDFDELFQFLFHKDRLVVMRAADTIEKISRNHPHYLEKHKKAIIDLGKKAENKELQWHIAQLIPRLQLNPDQLGTAWHLVKRWVKDKNNSRIVRVNSLQALFELKGHSQYLEKDLQLILKELEKEKIPSINARIRLLNKQS
jgi:hypothetical protein